MARRRLLLGLLPPEPLALELEGLRHALADRALGRIPPHVTIVPPANVPDAAFAEVFAAFRAAAGACPPLGLRLGPVGTFLPENPVVFVEVADAVGPAGPPAPLAQLRQDLQVGPLRRRDRHPFTPHLTIARSSDPAAIPAALGVLAAYDRTWDCDRVHLLHEVPTAAGGRRWEVLADAALGVRPHRIGTGGREVDLDASEVVGPDLAAVTGLAAVAAPPDPGRAAWWTPDRAQLVVTARRGAEVLGGAVVDLGPPGAGVPRAWDRARLVGIEVTTAARREGTGRHLLRRVEALVAGRGIGTLEAEAPAGSAVAAVLVGLGWTPATAGSPVLVRHLPGAR